MKTNNEPLVQRENTDLYKYINFNYLPGISKDYLNGRDSRKYYSYLNDFYLLRTALLKCNCSNEQEKYYKYLFLTIVNYYLYNYRSSLYYLNKIANFPKEFHTNDEVLTNYILMLKYKMIKLDKILVLVAGNFTKSKGFDIMEKKFNWKRKVKKVDFRTIKSFDEKKFIESFLLYEQIFIFAHGDEEGFYWRENDDDPITPSYIENIFKKRITNVSVLGLFSCGNSFNIPEIWSCADYFITDKVASYTDYSELFIFGYLRNYLKTFDVVASVEFGLNIPVIRAGSKTTIELYELGKHIRG